MKKCNSPHRIPKVEEYEEDELLENSGYEVKEKKTKDDFAENHIHYGHCCSPSKFKESEI
jgi:hypothetical protein